MTPAVMAKKSKVKAKATKATVAKAKPGGLQLSAAQRKAYNSAYSASYKTGEAALTAQYKAASKARVAAATARNQAEQIAFRRQAIANAAQSLRRSRLSAASSMQKVAAASHARARTAAIAAFAVSQSLRQAKLAHQNAALEQRVYADFERHMTILGRAQFVAKGEKAYAHEAVMRTLTTAEALGIEEVAFARAAKTAKRAVARTPAAYKRKTESPAVKAANQAQNKAAQTRIKATARAAGLAAAEAVPPVKKAPRTAPRPARLHPLGFMHGFGDPDGEDCLPASVANHLLLDLGVRLASREYDELARKLAGTGEIKDALDLLAKSPPWNDGAPLLVGYGQVPYNPARVLVIGYDSQEGRHAAVSAGNGNVVSWGEVLPLAETLAEEAVVEEAWDLLWVRHRPL